MTPQREPKPTPKRPQNDTQNDIDFGHPQRVGRHQLAVVVWAAEAPRRGRPRGPGVLPGTVKSQQDFENDHTEGRGKRDQGKKGRGKKGRREEEGKREEGKKGGNVEDLTRPGPEARRIFIKK